jgi:hypothetical protein
MAAAARAFGASGPTRLRRALHEGLAAVLGRDVHERVGRRLQELYDRHRDVELSDIATVYEPGRGYCGVDLTSATHDQFAIALVTTTPPGSQIHADPRPQVPFRAA